MSQVAISKTYSLLKPATSLSEIQSLCEMAVNKGVAGIVVPPLFVKKAKEFLGNSGIKLATVAGFPFGYSAVESKLAEIVLAIIDGADEIGLAINTAALKSNDWQYLAQELNHIMPVVKTKQKALTIILEAGLLTEDELMKCCDIYGIAGVDLIQVRSGTAGMTKDKELQVVRKYLANAIKIKAVTNTEDTLIITELQAAGADELEVITI